METYFIYEIQSTESGYAITTPTGYPASTLAEKNAAKAAFFSACAYPATCSQRTVVMIDHLGAVVDNCKITIINE